MPRVRIGDVCLGVEEAGQGEPLVLLHGFTGSTAAWGDHIDRFARRFRVLAVDLLGHGSSDAPADPDRYRVERCTSDLAALLEHAGINRAHCLGYSMGGRIALAFAANFPARVHRLVLESASPGIEDAAERRARAASDEALARRIERDGVAAFVDEWMRQPLFAPQSRLPESVRQNARALRCANRAEGLANSLRGAGTGAQESYWHRLANVTMPVLLIVGEEDAKFQQIAQRMAARLPRATLAVIPTAGHTTHLENPVAFTQRVVGFLSEKEVGDRPSAEAERPRFSSPLTKGG